MKAETQLEAAVFFVASRVSNPVLRAQFLQEACGDDERLRAAVEDLLRVEAGAEDFFATGRAAVGRPEMEVHEAEEFQKVQVAEVMKDWESAIEPGDEQVGGRVGRYLLVQKLGEGGCGTVYLAEQEEPVCRMVALKVIKLGMDTRSVIARFEAERQALARMDHPNIARVLDAGATARGRPYFVMELVPGTRITRYCDEHNLPTVERLKLFIQTCYAIQHAHQKGIIHRDIKPSNILVTLLDGKPVPKVIDFGIAKATEGRLTDRTVLTCAEQFVGTPAYMSPEQAENSGLDIDTRSDIYSLGVLLYELLTGRTPFDNQALMKSGWEEMRRTLREKEPCLPSTMITSLHGTELRLTARHRHAEPPQLISDVKGDLDWIAMKALEKNRNRRYETANGLAMDVQRFLSNEPVVARPPNRLYLLQKLVRRNQMVFAAGGAVALALLLGLGASTWLYFRELQSRQREALLRSEAEDRAKVTQAVRFVSEGRFDDADQVLQGLKSATLEPTLDGVSSFRSVGEWMAMHGRWPEAARCYSTLITIDKLSGWNAMTMDYQACGVVLAEGGDMGQYERFCQTAVTNLFANAPRNGILKNGGILKACLLFPADRSKLEMLRPMADDEAKKWPFNSDGWACIPPALWKYRCGDYAGAADLCRLALAQRSRYPACDATLHNLLAMCCYWDGQINESDDELAEGRELVESHFSKSLEHGRAGTGYWYDWVFANLLLREATRLTGVDRTSP